METRDATPPLDAALSPSAASLRRPCRRSGTLPGLIHHARLVRPQRRIRPTRPGQQLGVRSTLGHFSPRAQNDDLVALRGRRQAVRDKDAGAPTAEQGERVEDLALGGGVERRGGLVCFLLCVWVWVSVCFLRKGLG